MRQTPYALYYLFLWHLELIFKSILHFILHDQLPSWTIAVLSLVVCNFILNSYRAISSHNWERKLFYPSVYFIVFFSHKRNISICLNFSTHIFQWQFCLHHWIVGIILLSKLECSDSRIQYLFLTFYFLENTR